MNINKQELYLKMDKLRNFLLSLGLKQPFDIFEICSKIKNVGIETCNFNTRGFRGMVSLASYPGDLNCILVNSNLSYVEQNFHGIHELIHIYTSPKNSGQTFKCYDTVRPNQNSYVEWVANEGAAELLVSYKMLLPMIKENYHSMIEDRGTYEFCEKNASIFAVTPVVLQNRIDSLKYEIYQYMNNTPLNNIKIMSKNDQSRMGIKVKSLVELENDRFLEMWENWDWNTIA